MAPVQFVSLDDFRTRKLQPNEALSVFLHHLRQMLKQAMPGAPGNNYYSTNLLADYPLELRATGELNDLDAVTERAKLLMTIEEPQKIPAIQTNEFQEPSCCIISQVVCYKCQRPGHLQRNCPLTRRCYRCGQVGQGVSQKGQRHPKSN